MNIDLYSDRAKQAIQSAQSLAMARGHQQLAPEHLLKVLLEEKDGLSRALIESAGGRPDVVEQATDALLSKRPRVEGGSGQIYMAPETARVFNEADLSLPPVEREAHRPVHEAKQLAADLAAML